MSHGNTYKEAIVRKSFVSAALITAVAVVFGVYVAAQGSGAGEPTAFEELVRAIRAGFTYANVHTTRWPGGEVRGQIE
jgi:hypothetical protein